MGTFLCSLVLVRAMNGWQRLGRVGRLLLLPSQRSEYFGSLFPSLSVGAQPFRAGKGEGRCCLLWQEGREHSVSRAGSAQSCTLQSSGKT